MTVELSGDRYEIGWTARRGSRCRWWATAGRRRSRERGSEQKVTVVFGGPVDRDGKPVKVASASDVLPG